MLNSLIKFAVSQDGVTAVEYGLIAGLIGIATLAAMTSVGGSMQAMWQYISNCLAAANTCGQ
jgi:pilus assembly protein Flp/PilA